MTDHAGFKLKTSVSGVFAALGESLVSEQQEVLHLTYAGIPGDRHAGLIRQSGAREPWYPRGTEMRNERQLSILSDEELAEVAEALGLKRLKPEWIGGNIVLGGVPHLSKLPPRTLLMFDSGAVVRIDGDNGPCRLSGGSIARHVGDRPDIEFGFVKAAKGKRGLVGWVEREGEVRPGMAVTVLVWPQSDYPAA